MPSKQTPIGSGYTACSTAQEVVRGVDLRGKTAVVTGGHSGLGLATTRTLVAAGATVIVPTRSPEKARWNLADVPRVVHASLDLLDPKSIEAFSAGIVASKLPVHLLVNSAGVMATPLRRDARGYESQFAVNHLGHFQLTLQLWPALLAARGARVVSVSSRGHQISGVDSEDPNFDRRPYEKWIAYGQSKTANALFAVALDARGEGFGVRAFSVHPGTIFTDLARDLSDEELLAFGVPKGSPHGYMPPGTSVSDGGDYRSVEQGAATSIWCATNSMLECMGGLYCENCDVAPMRADGEPGAVGVRPWAIEQGLAERLWSLSEQLTGTQLR